MVDEELKTFLNAIMDSNKEIRYAAICNMDGEILFQRNRESVKNILTNEETQETLIRAINTWRARKELEGKIGRGMYAIAAYEKIKRITLPLGDDKLLFISMHNQNEETGKFSHSTDMNKIMSLLEAKPEISD